MSDHNTTDQELERARQNLELLQAQVDRLYDENRAFRRRIEHLHSDRETLRQKKYELETALYALRSRRIHRFRSLVSDLVHGKVRLRDSRKHLACMQTHGPPVPPPPPEPAFHDVQVQHSDLIPLITLPLPRPRRGDLRVAAVMDHVLTNRRSPMNSTTFRSRLVDGARS